MLGVWREILGPKGGLGPAGGTSLHPSACTLTWGGTCSPARPPHEPSEQEKSPSPRQEQLRSGAAGRAGCGGWGPRFSALQPDTLIPREARPQIAASVQDRCPRLAPDDEHAHHTSGQRFTFPPRCSRPSPHTCHPAVAPENPQALPFWEGTGPTHRGAREHFPHHHPQPA